MAVGEGNTRLQVVVSGFDLLKLKIWAKAHGKSPSAFVAQIAASRVESNLDLIDKLAEQQAKKAGVSVDDWIASLEGEENE